LDILKQDTPDRALALCCVDFFSVTDGPSLNETIDRLESQRNSVQRAVRDKVEARILCQSGEWIGGGWMGWSSIVPSPSDDQAAADGGVTWMNDFQTGWYRTSVTGMPNEDDAAVFVSSAESSRFGAFYKVVFLFYRVITVGQGVTMKANATFVSKTVAPLTSMLVNETSISPPPYVNASMRSMFCE
jgi:hypothetical protein